MSAPSKGLQEVLNDPKEMVCGHVCPSVCVRVGGVGWWTLTRA
ncbi:MAG: hypothetical protein ACK55Z_20770 [bacterium]